MMSSWPRAMARRIGLPGEIKFARCNVGLTLHIPCEAGDHVVDFDVAPGLHPDFIARSMLNKGWTFGSKLACPDHKRGTRRVKPKPQPTEKRSNPTMKPNAQVPDAAPSTEAKRAHRMVMMMLEEAYSEAKNQYHDGWNDARVAKESGASEKYVREVREDYFGPIGAPPELSELVKALDVLRTEATVAHQEVNKRCDDIAVRLANIARVNGWPHPV